MDIFSLICIRFCPVRESEPYKGIVCRLPRSLVLLYKLISGNSVLSSRSLLNEDEFFQGKDNTVVFKRFYEMVINCEMELQQYPFDNQTCSIGVNFSVDFHPSLEYWELLGAGLFVHFYLAPTYDIHKIWTLTLANK